MGRRESAAARAAREATERRRVAALLGHARKRDREQALAAKRHASALRGAETRRANRAREQALADKRRESALRGAETRRKNREAEQAVRDEAARLKETRRIARILDKLGEVPTVGQTKRGYDIPDPDYMRELADALDIDISDLYDMYYYGPEGD